MLPEQMEDAITGTAGTVSVSGLQNGEAFKRRAQYWRKNGQLLCFCLQEPIFDVLVIFFCFETTCMFALLRIY